MLRLVRCQVGAVIRLRISECGFGGGIEQKDTKDAKVEAVVKSCSLKEDINVDDTRHL